MFIECGVGWAMSEEVLPEPDERFSQLILDYFAPRHLIIAEGEGARCILDFLSTTPPAPGHKSIYYADTTRYRTPGLADSLLGLDVNSVDLFANRLDLLRRLPAIFSQTPWPFRIYIAASAWFIEAVEAIAKQAGIGKELILIEACEAVSRKVSCALCASFTISNSEERVRCSGCGAALRITNHYSADDHSHMGLPAEEETNSECEREAVT